MQTTLGHIEFKIDGSNKPFYADLMAFLGWTTLYDGAGTLDGAGVLGSAVREARACGSWTVPKLLGMTTTDRA